MSPTRAVLPIAVLAAGLALLVANVIVESEPGAVPLLLVLVGAGWLTVAWVRTRSRRGRPRG